MVKLSGLKLRERFQRLLKSIAFYPALIGLSFLALSYLSIRIDFSPTGKEIKSQLSWLSLRDASTARSIISAIVAGLISLTVFSFSMVMIVLNQAASQMSNRVLDKLIGNRFQQAVLGIYIGTIVYALFLLSTIRDIDSGIYVPALSTYLLILLTVLDIFLFIYFLHYITQSVKYEVIIERIYEATKKSLLAACCLREESTPDAFPFLPHLITSDRAGTYEGIDTEVVLQFCERHRCVIGAPQLVGDFVLKGVPVISSDVPLNAEQTAEILSFLRIEMAQSIENNYVYGFRQLMEIALKALSPGINDPDTAVLSLHALFRLYLDRAQHAPQRIFQDKDGNPALYVRERSFEQIFGETLAPVWDYGKSDRIIRTELEQLLRQLQCLNPSAIAGELLLKIEKKRNAKKRNKAVYRPDTPRWYNPIR